MKFNLLYNEENIANGKNLFPDKSFFDLGGLISTHLNEYGDDKVFDVQKFNIHDFKNNKNENYFYSVCPMDMCISELCDYNLTLSAESLDVIKSNDNVYIILCTEHEPMIKNDFESLSKFCKKMNLENKIICLSNNSINDDID